jgi:endonuclease/exonuclease/phosphatase family metal-dependent hydrolase
MRLMLLLVLGALTTTVQGQDNAPLADGLQMKLLTFNIRYGTAEDGQHAWPNRKELVFAVVRDEMADFCGLQEALRFQIDAIRQAVPGYAEHGRARDDGQTQGEYSAILYRDDRWELVRGETAWLSDTPQQPGSKSWGNTIPRVVTWGRFVERMSGRTVCVVNTHFDHRSQPSRIKSAEFLVQLIAQQAAGTPLVVMGDLNVGETNPAVELLKRGGQTQQARLIDSFRSLHPDASQVGTYHGFTGNTAGEKIDYVLCDPSAKVLRAEILRLHEADRYPSDHFPVCATIVFPR